MRIFFTYFLIFLIILLCNNAICQNMGNLNAKGSMNYSQLSNYRQSIWDTLPAAVSWVNDYEGLFNPDEENTLERLIEHFERETSIEIMIVTVDTNMVAKEKFSQFTDRLLKIWGIGKKLKKNGIVISISSGYHEIQISTDVGIEKFMNENEKAQIIKKFFIRDYRHNKYYDGTFNGLNALLKTIRKTYAFEG